MTGAARIIRFTILLVLMPAWPARGMVLTSDPGLHANFRIVGKLQQHIIDRDLAIALHDGLFEAVSLKVDDRSWKTEELNLTPVQLSFC